MVPQTSGNLWLGRLTPNTQDLGSEEELLTFAGKHTSKNDSVAQFLVCVRVQ